MALFGNLIESFLMDTVAPIDYDERKKMIGTEIHRLNQIYQEIMKLQEQGIIEFSSLNRRTQLWHILGTEEESGLAMRLESIRSNNLLESLQVTLKPLILEAYELTSQILQDLQIIPNVKIVMTHRTKHSFTRVENFEINNDDVTLELRNGALALRFVSSKVRPKVMGGKTAKEQSTTDISQHYRNFVADLQRTAVNPNWGVVAEAFERHWEMLASHIVPPDWDTSGANGGEGEAWQLYHLSSGSDPYYTGPDTELSQVKSTNASIVSNVNTVLNTVKAIIQMSQTQVLDPAALQKLKVKYLQAFQKKSNAINKDEEDFFDSINEEIIELLKLDN